jgi:hypothetical protein
MEKGMEHKQYMAMKSLQEAVVSFAVGGASEFDAAVKALEESGDEDEGEEKVKVKEKKKQPAPARLAVPDGSIDSVKCLFEAVITKKKEQREWWPHVLKSTLFAMMVSSPNGS